LRRVVANQIPSTNARAASATSTSVPPNPDESPDDTGNVPPWDELDEAASAAGELEPPASPTTAAAVAEAGGLVLADGRVVAAGFAVGRGVEVAALAVGWGVGLGVGFGVGLGVAAGPDATRSVPVTNDATPS
jgi:hypothetical protein